MDDPRDGTVERQEHRFVLRLWREPSAAPARWRGSVYEVASAARVASCELSELWDFIMLRVGEGSD